MGGLSNNCEKKARQLANLRPRKKGDPALPGAGRPKSKALSEAYRALLLRDVPGDSKQRTYAELIAEAIAREAVKGKIQAAVEMADRTEGRARQSVEHPSEEDRKIKIIIKNIGAMPVGREPI